MNLPVNVEYIINTLEKAGYEGYAVGGCVRDHLMGLEPHDYDITTSALPEKVKELFGHTVDTGIEHGTVTVMIGKTGYEVTTFRIDGKYSDSRHPESVTFTSDLEGDLSRRDFTVNAIAYSPEKGYVDMFSGVEDIKLRIIRGVGDPDKRFKEDALRMMRALRFSAQLDFSVEAETMKALRENASLIVNISSERVRDELLKLVLSKHTERLALMLDSGLMGYVLPELVPLLENVNLSFYRRLNVLSQSPALRLAYILFPLGEKKVKDILKRLKFDNKTIALTLLLVRNTNIKTDDMYCVRRIISLSGSDSMTMIEYLCAVNSEDISRVLALHNKIRANKDCCSLKELAVDGKVLAEMGIKGRAVGRALAAALDYVMRFPDRNEREKLLGFLRSIS